MLGLLDLLVEYLDIFACFVNVVNHLLLLNGNRLLQSLEKFHVLLLCDTACFLKLLMLEALSLQLLISLDYALLHLLHFVGDEAERVL